MSKNILIISTSPRFNSNSDLLAQSFEKGALEAGHLVERVTLRDKTIQFCKGCLSCVKTQKCVIQDDVNEIVEKMKEANVLVFSTPIYYYEMCGQMKTLLDRANHYLMRTINLEIFILLHRLQKMEIMYGQKL